MGVFRPRVSEQTTKPIIFELCPVCNAKIRKGGRVPDSHPRFLCTNCGYLILNSNNNRCVYCKKLFADSTILSEHVFFDHKAEREKAKS